MDEDVFTITIKNPEVNDSGRYSCVVRECNDLTCKAYLEVEREFELESRIELFQSNLLQMKLGSFKSKIQNAKCNYVYSVVLTICSRGPGVWLREEAGEKEGRQDEAEGQAQVQDGRPQRQGQVVQGRQGDQEERPALPHQERRRGADAGDQGGREGGLGQVHLQDRGVRKGGGERDHVRPQRRR